MKEIFTAERERLTLKLTGYAALVGKDDGVRAVAEADRFEPRLGDDGRADLMGRWHEAVAAALASAHQRPGGLNVGNQHVNPLP
jgi:hypothetical protein